MSRPVYLEFDEEVVSALQKIKKAGADDLILVVPKGARVLKNLTSLKLLKQQTERLNKTISVATADERGKVLAGRAGIAIVTDTRNLVHQPAARSASSRLDVARRANVDAPVISKEEKSTATAARQTPDAADEELSTLIGPAAESGEIKIPAKARRRKDLLYFVLPIVAALAVIGVFAFYVLPSATVTVHARLEKVNREMEIQIDSTKDTVDSENRLVPGKKITEELADSKTYVPSGKKNVGEKASGFVTLYNFTDNTLVLKSKTTHLQVDGKTYYFLQDVGSIRPTQLLTDGKTPDPASLIAPVPIVAGAGGEDSNLPVNTRFEVYNEVFGHQPEVLYAQNANPIAGGLNKEITMIAEPDVVAARQDLQSSILEKLRGVVAEKYSSNYKVVDGAYKMEVLEEALSDPINSDVEKFQLTQRARVTALIFDETQLKNVMESRITSLLPENKYLDNSGGQTLTEKFISLDLNTGTGTVTANMEANLKYRLNAEFLSDGLLGKSATEVKEILLARPEINQVDVTLRPFWVKKVPYFKSKLDFKIVD
jgi:hypothetical protein